VGKGPPLSDTGRKKGDDKGESLGDGKKKKKKNQRRDYFGMRGGEERGGMVETTGGNMEGSIALKAHSGFDGC